MADMGFGAVSRRAVIGGWFLALTVSFAVRAEEPARSAHAGYTETIPGAKVRFEMVAIPGGTFFIGGQPGEAGHGDDESPKRPIAIRPFCMGKTEVTWDEYDEFRKGG